MLLTVKEMEVLCVFHAGSLSATADALRSAAEGSQPHPRLADIKTLLEKPSRMKDGDSVCLAFDSAK